ncbi:PDZ domain-containing protein [Sulfurimonas aquatica]|uniref:PDZ domain-containing protein n=1 Tax=Sulfurimonas aquatica TaxID=2672570 RepID=A0A975AYD4_9BACT|nr:PDZ domain-containing protein [Sulfurimonas aquatica]QSZ40849.1 PDZ domain-containing protein [Sulfurimonas aquatica]
MIRLLLIVTLLIVNIFACEGGYDSCIQKIKDSHTIQNSSLLIPVKNNKLLVYSKQTPNAKILKCDPFLSLYLVENKKGFKYPFDVNMRLQLGSAAVNNKVAIEGRVKTNQVGLNALATYSEPLTAPSLITSSCCSLEGIVTPRGIIQKEYIQRFLSSKSADYSDIGIRVKNDEGFVIVSASNPYIQNNPFKKGDCIVELNGKKIKAASLFMRKILFSKVGSKHKIKIKRGSEYMTFKVITTKRYGGGELSDTFLEQKGIYFDSKLRIIKLPKNFSNYGLILGDQLMQVNGVRVKTQDELLRYIEDFKEFSSLLFMRRNFQFFVNIK